MQDGVVVNEPDRPDKPNKPDEPNRARVIEAEG